MNKKVFEKNGVRITLEVIDNNEFEKLIKELLEIDYEFADTIFIKKQAEEQHRNALIVLDNMGDSHQIDELTLTLAVVNYTERVLNDWSSGKYKEDFETYKEQQEFLKELQEAYNELCE